MAEPELVLALTPDDRRVRVGTSDLLAADLGEEADLDWEFYDAAGRRLVRLPGGFAPVDEDERPREEQRRLLVDRIDLVQALIQRRLTQEVLESFDAGRVPVRGRERIPRVSGDLDDVLVALNALAGATPESPEDPGAGSWLRALWIRLGG